MLALHTHGSFVFLCCREGSAWQRSSAGGTYAFVVGAAIALHFLTTRFYDPAWVDASLPVWKILDPLEVIGLAIVLIVAFTRKRRVDADAGDRSVTGST